MILGSIFGRDLGGLELVQGSCWRVAGTLWSVVWALACAGGPLAPLVGRGTPKQVDQKTRKSGKVPSVECLAVVVWCVWRVHVPVNCEYFLVIDARMLGRTGRPSFWRAKSAHFDRRWVKEPVRWSFILQVLLFHS